jgi:acyl carrier protein
VAEDVVGSTLDAVLIAAKEVLLCPVAPDDNFFAMNGDSFKAVQLAYRIEEILERDIDLALLYEVETFEAFAKVVDEGV